MKAWHSRGGVTISTKNEARSWARSVVQSETYKKSVELRVKHGVLPPAVECLLLHYAYGKPVDQINVTSSQQDLSQLSTEELALKVAELQKLLDETSAQEAALPASFRKVG